MKITTEVRGGNRLGNKLRQIRERLERNRGVLVGVPRGTGNYEDGAPIAVIAAAHEFGATIEHPGGTSYGYRTEKDAVAGKSRFLKKGQGFMEAGVTGPYKITIPERSFLRVPLRQGADELKAQWRALLPKVISGELTMQNVLDQVGGAAADLSRQAISEGIQPANAPSTVAKKKGSNKPLIDTGGLRRSITHVVED